MKKFRIIIIILIISLIGICTIRINYISSNKEKESYTYIICDEDDPSTTLALLSIHFKKNGNISLIKLYVNYDNYVLKYISKDNLIYRSDIVKNMEIIDEAYELKYSLQHIPYHRILAYESISIDLSDSKINNLDLFEYLGLSKYIKNNSLKFSMEELTNDSSFPYNWIIENGELSYYSFE